MKKKLAIIGCGNMGQAIALGLAKNQTDLDLLTYTPTQTRAVQLASKIDGKSISKISELKGCDYFLLACKPQQFDELAMQLKNIVTESSLVISVLAGTSSTYIQQSLNCKVARVMPNTPCLIGQGVSGIYFLGASDEEKTLVQNIFEPISKVFIVDSDKAIDAITALSGSGPAYIFELARIMASKAADLGLNKEASISIVTQLIKGSALLMEASKETPEQLRNRVTSKKGTTEAALNFLKSENFEDLFNQAIQTAFDRARELSK